MGQTESIIIQQQSAQRQPTTVIWSLLQIRLQVDLEWGGLQEKSDKTAIQGNYSEISLLNGHKVKILQGFHP